MGRLNSPRPGREGATEISGVSRVLPNGDKIVIKRAVFRGPVASYTHGHTDQAEAKPARNAPCTCGSGAKFKRCCGKPA